jgi:putative IMPACT (imprinted ancient) family translation regulator
MRTVSEVLKDREERNEKVHRIIKGVGTYDQKIKKIIEVYKQYGELGSIEAVSFGIYSRIASFFRGKAFAFLDEKSLKANGIVNSSSQYKKYLATENGISFDKLAEEVISFLNQEVEQTGQQLEIDFNEVREELRNLFNGIDKYPIHF